MVFAFEKRRQAQIAKNKALLESLMIKPIFEPKEERHKKETKKPTKRKASSQDSDYSGKSDSESETEEPAPKAPKKTKAEVDSSGLRRSARNAGKKVDYRSEQGGEQPLPVSFKAGRVSENKGHLGREGGKRVKNFKVFGSIPGIEVGTWWETREGCSADAIHAPWVGGISGGPDGAWSVALSGGYEDDVDLGYAFTYTGSGGRDLKGTKDKPKNLRTAPQSCNQTFDNHFNRALKKSSETKKPVRVIRGYKSKSRYAPSEGYRYDGLYVVERAWMENGLNEKGYSVCKFAFKRLPDQPPIPVRYQEAEEEDADNDGEGGQVSNEGSDNNESEGLSANSDVDAVVDRYSDSAATSDSVNEGKTD